MEGIITLVIIGFVLTFGSQLLKGIGNIFAASGRIGGWIVGIILVVFLLKTLVFSSTPEYVELGSGEPGSVEHFIEETGADGSTLVNGVIMYDGDGYKWDDNEKEYVENE
jgi:hypothetical protein|tara:strand:+ start:132 stop:461 length:330 start_codon:yes stop_codon:yes gene_type:complete